jgi:hypothetical protein
MTVIVMAALMTTVMAVAAASSMSRMTVLWPGDLCGRPA